MLMTTKEFAEKFDINYTQATGAIGFLLSLGVVEKTTESVREVGKKGKPSAKFRFPIAKTIIFDLEAYEREKKRKEKLKK